MNHTQYEQIVNSIFEECRSVLTKKNVEYSGSIDPLDNFKRNATKQGIFITDVWKTYYGKHVDSIDTYIRRVRKEAYGIAFSKSVLASGGKHPSGAEFEAQLLAPDTLKEAIERVDAPLSEPIEGRFIDIINYCVFGIAILRDIKASEPQ